MTRPPCTVLLATHNADKVKEISLFLQGLAIQLVSAKQFPHIPQVEEDEPTLVGNAIKKARTLAEATGLMTLADDTGLEVDALNGAPGVYSSRYAGENVTYSQNVDKLLADLRGVPMAQRTARFRCVIAIVKGDFVQTVDGVCEGLILEARRGDGGFGYDPVFYVPSTAATFAEMDLADKNKISHRGLALLQARQVLENFCL
jgi:XTP/dITP diphosphohydrolase